MKKTILLLTVLITGFLTAQNEKAVVIYSDNGENFTLFLNNIQQHEFPTNNVVTTGLTANAYGLKIVFENPNKEPLKKTLYLPNESVELTFKIIEKKGKSKLRLVNQNRLAPMYEPTPNRPVIVYSPTPIFTQTTTTTSTTVGNDNPDNVSVGISVGGVNMDVNVNTNNSNSGVTYSETTTTTTTTTTTGGVVEDHYIMDGYDGPYGCPWPMHEADFNEALHTIASKDWDDTKLSIAKQVVRANCLFADQVREIVKLFDWEDKKLEFAKFAYDYTYDTGNYFKVAQTFEWESSVEELNEYISGH